MKIVLINGSPRKNGATDKILHAFEEQLSSENDVQTAYIDIAEHNIRLSFGIRPFVRSQGKGYQGVLDKWKSIGIRI